jgi:hypothetical protein
LAVADGKELARREVLVSTPELDDRHVKQGNVLLLNCKARLIAELQGNVILFLDFLTDVII